MKLNRKNIVFGSTTGASLVLVSAMLCALGCSEEESTESTQTVEHEINDEADFSQFRTFTVVDPSAEAAEGETDSDAADAGVEEPPYNLADLNAEVLTEIDAQMTGLGLTRDDDAADLSVTYFAKKETFEDYVTFYDAYYGWYWGYEYTWTMEVEYDTGTLIIDVVDLGASDGVGDDLLVFRGIAEGLLGSDKDVQLLQIRNAVDAIFEGWPTP
jgi:hypothetical protein